MSDMSDMSDGRGRIDVGALLTIDVESELRKLTQAQLQGPWQLPAELVRWALHYGATRVEVELGRQQLLICSDGGGIPSADLREFAALLDAKRSPERRHRALSALERAGALALLGLVGLDPASLRITSPGSGGSGGVTLSWDRRGLEIVRFNPPGPKRAEIIVRGAKFDRTRAREWLIDVARYANATIVIDGRMMPPIGTCFDNAFAVTRVDAPVPGILALPREGELARLYLLQDGLVSTHMSVPGAPCFEAAIETRGFAEPTASAARLRDLVAPMIPAIVQRAIAYMIERGEQGASLAPGDRTRLTQLLLTSARHDREHAKTIARIPLFRALERDGRERWCDLLALRQSVQAEGGERLLTALFPDQSPAEYTPEARIYILDESERAFLGDILELSFRQPRRRVVARRGLDKLLREGPSLLRNRDLFALLRPSRHPLPDAALTVEERVFLVQLRAQLDNCDVAMCEGTGPVRRIGSDHHKLLLPRESPRVKTAMIAIAKDPCWIYPALLALFDGRQFPERSRRRWKLLRA